METNNNNLKSYIQHPIVSFWRDGYVSVNLVVDDPTRLSFDLSVYTASSNRSYRLTLLQYKPVRDMLDVVRKSLYTFDLEWSPEEMITSASLRNAVFTPDGLAFSRRDPAKFLTPRTELDLRAGCADPSHPTSSDVILSLYLNGQDRNNATLFLPAQLVPEVTSVFLQLQDLIDEYEALDEDTKVRLAQPD